MRAIARPYEVDGAHPRIVARGPDVALGDHATNGVALVLHELATNAAKYGALSRDGGTVAVSWTIEGPELVLTWQEQGGPLVGGAPATLGFGSHLVKETVASSTLDRLKA